MVIQHNLLAMNAQRQYKVNTDIKRKSTEKLSSGYRINRAADDAAGLAISEKMRSQIRGLNQGVDNCQDGVSLCQVADGAMAEVDDMLHRMNELCIQAANGTNTSADRDAIDKEVQQLKTEIDRIGNETEFNEIKVLQGGNKVERKEESYIEKEIVEIPGKLGEPEFYSKNNSAFAYHRSALLYDFSSVKTQEDFKDLDGLYISFTCWADCGQWMEIVLDNEKTGIEVNRYPETAKDYNNGWEGRLTKSDPNYGTIHAIITYTVGTKDLNSSSELIDRLNNQLGRVYVGPGLGLGEDANTVSHCSDLDIIYSTGNKTKLNVYGYYNPGGDPGALWRGHVYLGKASREYTTEERDVEKNIITETITKREINIQFANHSDSYFLLKLPHIDCDALDMNDISAKTAEEALASLDMISEALSKVNEQRSMMGAQQNGIEALIRDESATVENTQAAESRIRDTDMASEMVKYSIQNILLQVGEAMMAQANQNPQGILNLLS